MISEIRRRLENGERVELECIDEHGFLYHLGGVDFRSNPNSRILSRGEFTVDCVDCDGNILLEQGGYIFKSELQYFRIKDEGCTFNDLVDVAVKAALDSKLIIEHIDGDCVCWTSRDQKWFEVERSYTNETILGMIDRIKSLYCETFTIESEEDELRIKRPVKSILLANGVEIIDEEKLMLLSAGLHLNGGAVGGIKIPFSFLKGATVTQQKRN